MKKEWTTKTKDMYVAELIMEEYAHEQETDALGLFELVLDVQEKRMNVRLAGWVTMLAQQFKSMYGASQGDYVTRQVISHCITQGQTIH